jgi:tripartite-type tricarboxylate transporter receptor subunit TctC
MRMSCAGRVSFLIGMIFVVTAVPAWARNATGQGYPAGPVRIITGGASTLPDVITRQVAPRLSERWGQSVVVDNRPGAGLTIGTAMAAKAAPDGYTLLVSDRTALTVAPHLHQKLAYETLRNFSPVTLIALAPQLLVAHPSLPAANLREFMEHAKRHAGSFNYAGAGPGTGSHISGELLKQVTGINFTIVQYKGGSAAMMAILSGEAHAGFNAIPVSLPHVKAGKVKAYAITSPKRFAGAPDIPTAIEAGLDFETQMWVGMLAPARVPAAIIDKVNRDVVEVLRAPVLRDAFLSQGAESAPGTPAEFAAFLRTETLRWGQVVRAAGIKPE